MFDAVTPTTVFWQATATDAFARPMDYTLGNNIATLVDTDQVTGAGEALPGTCDFPPCDEAEEPAWDPQAPYIPSGDEATGDVPIGVRGEQVAAETLSVRRFFGLFARVFGLGRAALPEAEAGFSRILWFTSRNLQKGFTKHGKDFGLTGNWNPSRAADFARAVNQHINSPGVQRIVGRYHGEAVIHFVDPRTGLNVMSDLHGYYVSG